MQKNENNLLSGCRNVLNKRICTIRAKKLGGSYKISIYRCVTPCIRVCAHMELHVQAKENGFKWPLTVVQNFRSSREQEMYVYIPSM